MNIPAEIPPPIPVPAKVTMNSLPTTTFPGGTAIGIGGSYQNGSSGFIILEIRSINVGLDTGESVSAQMSRGTWSASITPLHTGARTLTVTGFISGFQRAANPSPQKLTVTDPGVSALSVLSASASGTSTYELQVRAASPIGIARVSCPDFGNLSPVGGDVWQGSASFPGGPGTRFPLMVTAQTNGSGAGDGAIAQTTLTLTLVDSTRPQVSWTAPAEGEVVGPITVSATVTDSAGGVVSAGLPTDAVICTIDPGSATSSSVTLTRSGGPGDPSQWQGVLPVPPNTGPHHLQLRCTDSAGNFTTLDRLVDAELVSPGQWLGLGQPPGSPMASGAPSNPVGVAEAVGVVAAWDAPAATVGLHVLVKGSDGHLWADRFDGHTWQWEDHTTTGGPTIVNGVGAITIQATAPGLASTPFVFVLGTDGHLWARWATAGAWQWSDYGSPGNAPINAPVGVTTLPGDPGPTVFVQGHDGQLWLLRWIATGSGSAAPIWESQGSPAGRQLGLALVGAATASFVPDDPARVYALLNADDGHLWINDPGSSASPWTDLGTPGGQESAVTVTGPIGVTVNGSQHVRTFVTDSATGQLWVNDYNGQTSGWGMLGTPPTITGPFPFNAAAGALADTTSDLASYAHLVGTDGHLWIRDWEGFDLGGGSWEDAGQPGPAAAGGVAVTTSTGPGLASHLNTLVNTVDERLWIRRSRAD